MHLFTSEATGDRETMMRMSWPDHSEIHRITIVEELSAKCKVLSVKS